MYNGSFRIKDKRILYEPKVIVIFNEKAEHDVRLFLYMKYFLYIVIPNDDGERIKKAISQTRKKTTETVLQTLAFLFSLLSPSMARALRAIKNPTNENIGKTNPTWANFLASMDSSLLL